MGTALSTASDAPALGGVYKLVEIERDGRRTPTLKLSYGKTTYPGRKQVWRVPGLGELAHDVISRVDDGPPDGGKALLERVMVDGRRTRAPSPLSTVRARAIEQVGRLPKTVRQLKSAERYAVVVSDGLRRLTNDLRDVHAEARE